MATTICSHLIKWPYFWLTKWPKHSILVNTWNGEPLWQASITAHRLPSTQNTAVRSVGIFGNTPHRTQLSSSLDALGYDRFKGFNDLQWFNGFNEAQRLQGVERFKEVQRWRESFEHLGGEAEAEIEMLQKCNDFQWCCRSATVSQKVLHKNNTDGEIEIGVLHKNNTLFLWHYSVCHDGTARHNILLVKRLIISMT